MPFRLYAERTLPPLPRLELLLQLRRTRLNMASKLKKKKRKRVSRETTLQEVECGVGINYVGNCVPCYLL